MDNRKKLSDAISISITMPGGGDKPSRSSGDTEILKAILQELRSHKPAMTATGRIKIASDIRPYVG